MKQRRLSASAIERWQPEDKRIEVPDRDCPGLYLVVFPSGMKSWAIRYRIAGRHRRLTVCKHLTSTKVEEVRATAREYLDMAKQDIDPVNELKKIKVKNAESQENTFSSVAKNFIELYAKKRNRTWKQTESILKKYVQPQWGDRPISDITRQDVTRLLDQIETRSGFYMANRVLAAVRKLFNWCVMRGDLAASPIVIGMSRGKEVERDRPLKEVELKSVWRAASEIGYPYGDWARMLILLGQKARETAQMRWCDLELVWDEEESEKLVRGVWTLPGEMTKNGKTHTLPLPELALEIIASVPRVKGKTYVFSPLKGESYVQNYSRTKVLIDAASGVSGWRFHDLRHTWATFAAKLQVSYEIRERIQNHALPGEGDRYDHYHHGELKLAALEAWCNYLVGTILDGRGTVINVIPMKVPA